MSENSTERDDAADESVPSPVDPAPEPAAVGSSGDTSANTTNTDAGTGNDNPAGAGADNEPVTPADAAPSSPAEADTGASSGQESADSGDDAGA